MSNAVAGCAAMMGVGGRIGVNLALLIGSTDCVA